jgi:hypothetical protein
VPLGKEVTEVTDEELPSPFFSSRHLVFYFYLDCRNRLTKMVPDSAEDIEAWAQAEGVPSLTDPFIQKYLSGRDALVEQEKKQRSGR